MTLIVGALSTVALFILGAAAHSPATILSCGLSILTTAGGWGFWMLGALIARYIAEQSQ